MEGNASVYQDLSVSCKRITGEGRAEFVRAWGHGFDQERAGGGTDGATQYLCAETINPLREQI